MGKQISIKSGFSSILLWSVISAAFIGPGTVTSCAKAGSQFGYQLLWALSFSTLATILLQEIISRIGMATGKNLGEILSLKYQQQNTSWISKGLFFAVAIGCAAYEAGNILGAVAGLRLLNSIPSIVFTTIVTVAAFLILSSKSISFISKLMGAFVFLMGLLFIFLVFSIPHIEWKKVFTSLFIPSIPQKSGSLIIALVGTTIVPYNLFLGSGIKHNQSLKEMRWGISIAVLVGGIVSMFILLAGTILKDNFSFTALYNSIVEKTGTWGGVCFALGLFAAGLSSAITAPLAAAICGQSLLGATNTKWDTSGKYYKATWICVLAFGFLFGLFNVQPIPAIIMAQALNGLLLPLVCIAIYMTITDKKILIDEYQHNYTLNYGYLVIIGITSMLGIYNIQKAILRILPAVNYTESKIIWIAFLLSLSIVIILKSDQK